MMGYIEEKDSLFFGLALCRQAGKGWTKDPKKVPSTVNNFFCPYSCSILSLIFPFHD